MILTIILLLMAVALTMFAAIIISIGGTAFIIIFADIIVCALFIFWILKRLFKKRKNDWAFGPFLFLFFAYETCSFMKGDDCYDG